MVIIRDHMILTRCEICVKTESFMRILLYGAKSGCTADPIGYIGDRHCESFMINAEENARLAKITIVRLNSTLYKWNLVGDPVRVRST